MNSNHVGFWSNESRPAASRHASSLQAASVHTNASASPCVPADTPNPGAYAVAPRMGNEDQEMWTSRTRQQLRGCEMHAPAVARRTRQQLRGARFEVWNAFIHAAHHTRAQVSVKSTPLSGDLCAASWSSSPIRGATDSACLAYADIRQHRFRKRLFARRTRRIVEQAARQQAARLFHNRRSEASRVVPQPTHAPAIPGMKCFHSCCTSHTRKIHQILQVHVHSIGDM